MADITGLKTENDIKDQTAKLTAKMISELA
jgi:hypothetical protein